MRFTYRRYLQILKYLLVILSETFDAFYLSEIPSNTNNPDISMSSGSRNSRILRVTKHIFNNYKEICTVNPFTNKKTVISGFQRTFG